MASQASTTSFSPNFSITLKTPRKEIQFDLKNPQGTLIDEKLIKGYERITIILEINQIVTPVLKIDNQMIKMKSCTQIQGKTTSTWEWNIEGKIGYHTIQFFSPRLLYQGRIFVSPSKLDRKNYEKMINEIERSAYQLMLDFYRDQYMFFIPKYADYGSDAQEQYEKIKEIMPKLIIVLRTIERAPHRSLKEITKSAFIFSSHRLSKRTINYILKNPQNLTTSTKQITFQKINALKNDIPLKVLGEKAIITFDNPENQLIKHFIQNILNSKIGSVIKLAKQEINRIQQNYYQYGPGKLQKITQLNRVIIDCKEHRKQLQKLLYESEFLKPVGPLKAFPKYSTVLQREKNYREFYKLYLDFIKNRSLIFSSDQFFLKIKEIHELYEIWCTIKIVDIARNLGFEIVQMALFNIQGSQFAFRLTSGNNPIITLENNGNLLKIHYQKQYLQTQLTTIGYGSRGGAQKPDITLELFKQPTDPPSILIFDAKYRKSSQDILDKLSAYKNEIGIPSMSLVEQALALWIDKKQILYPHAGTGGLIFIPTKGEKRIKKIMKDFVS